MKLGAPPSWSFEDRLSSTWAALVLCFGCISAPSTSQYFIGPILTMPGARTGALRMRMTPDPVSLGSSSTSITFTPIVSVMEPSIVTS